MYRDTSSVDCAPRELTHACSRSDTADFGVDIFRTNRSASYSCAAMDPLALVQVSNCAVLYTTGTDFGVDNFGRTDMLGVLLLPVLGFTEKKFC